MIDKYKKLAQEKYLKTAKGIAARRRAVERYNHSRKGLMARSRYLASSKGVQAVELSKQRRSLLN